MEKIYLVSEKRDGAKAPTYKGELAAGDRLIEYRYDVYSYELGLWGDVTPKDLADWLNYKVYTGNAGIFTVSEGFQVEYLSEGSFEYDQWAKTQPWYEEN
mgnify:CR=1 FL=1